MDSRSLKDLLDLPPKPIIGSNGPVSSDQDDVSEVLVRLDAGEAGAADDLFQALYSGLRAIAGREMGRERADHTLQPTALVHEAWIRLFGVHQAVDSFRTDSTSCASSHAPCGAFSWTTRARAARTTRGRRSHQHRNRGAGAGLRGPGH